MTTVEITLNLPDQIAEQARKAGLLRSDAVEAMIRERLRRQVGEELRAMLDKLAEAKIPPMTEDEVQTEIDAARRARKTRRA